MVCNEKGYFEQEKLEALSSICEQCAGAKLVLASEMRKTHAEKKKALAGLKHPMFGLEMAEPDATPTYGAGRTFAEDNWLNRPFEITQWFRTSKMEVSGWVAIDSHDLLHRAENGGTLEGHFVRTDPKEGLTGELADQVIEKLNRARVVPMGLLYLIDDLRAVAWQL